MDVKKKMVRVTYVRVVGMAARVGVLGTANKRTTVIVWEYAMIVLMVGLGRRVLRGVMKIAMAPLVPAKQGFAKCVNWDGMVIHVLRVVMTTVIDLYVMVKPEFVNIVR